MSNKILNAKDIHIHTVQMTNKKLINYITNTEMRKSLWDESQSSRYIESIILQFPTPAFWVDIQGDKKILIDGVKRLYALKQFFDNKFKLQRLEYFLPYAEHYYYELPKHVRRKIKEHENTLYIIDNYVPIEIKKSLFKKIKCN